VSNSDDRATEVRIRRAPKFSVFLILGAVLGVIAALVLTVTFPIDPNVGFGPTFGYFAIFGVTAGVFVGAVIAIILDRLLARRAKTVSASVDYLQPAPDEPDEA
jgi:hypothetical protein